MTVTRPDQARALQEAGLLSRFLKPASPSEVARTLGLPANLVHHHAKRLRELGLLEEVGRDGGRVLYQLVARTFQYGRDLLPPGDPFEATAVSLRQISGRFLAEYERSDRRSHFEDPDWMVCRFGDTEADRTVPDALSALAGRVSEGRQAHFQARTLRLTPERYEALVSQIARLVYEAASEKVAGAGACTLAFLAFDGPLEDGVQDSHSVSSFVKLR